MIDEQETISAASPKWISVKDITPDDDGEVLACYGKDVFIAHFEGDGWVVYVQALAAKSTTQQALIKALRR